MGVKIEKFMGLGLSVMLQDEQRTTWLREKEMSESNGCMSVILSAIHKLKAKKFDTFGIYDGKERTIEEFKAARTYDVPLEHRNPPLCKFMSWINEPGALGIDSN